MVVVSCCWWCYRARPINIRRKKKKKSLIRLKLASFMYTKFILHLNIYIACVTLASHRHFIIINHSFFLDYTHVYFNIYFSLRTILCSLDIPEMLSFIVVCLLFPSISLVQNLLDLLVDFKKGSVTVGSKIFFMYFV